MDLIELLTEKNIPFKNTNNPAEILIRCTSGEHTDKNPSLSFNIEKNTFKCWSCGFKGGIHKFLESLGISTRIPIYSKQEYKIKKLRYKLHKITNNLDSIEMPISITKAIGTFKGISSNTLKEFEAFFTSEMDLEDYLCFPIYQFKKLKFIEGRNRFSTSNKSKYSRQPRNSKITNILFPLDKLVEKNKVTLVEGIFDMLNLWDKEYKNILCIFGTNNFGKEKVELLERLGIFEVNILMDGDDSGYRASLLIQKLLENKDIATNIINLPKDKDPGNLTIEEANYYLGPPPLVQGKI